HKVTECCHREVCCQVSKCIEECCMKQVCVRQCKEVAETCYKCVTRRECVPCTTYKTVTRRIVECVDEPCDPCRNGWGGGNGLFRGLHNRGRGDACNESCGDACGKSDCNFDPCSCKTFHLFDRLHSRRDDCNPCGTTTCCAPVPTTRKVWKVRCV